MLTAGDELAAAASKALGSDLKFEDITEYVVHPLLLDRLFGIIKFKY